MKIVRNGMEIELTHDELREAFEIMHTRYLREDIESRIEDMEVEFPEETICYMVQRVDKCLSNNDSYWESYWMTIENIIEEQMEG